VTFEKAGKYLEAKVTHNSERVVVSASTKESAYREQGLSLSDTDAAKNLARILARRCHEAGILHLHNEVLDEKTSEKAKAFVNELKEEGMLLREPDYIFPRRKRDI
jgi:ribosomal protein L18